MDQFYSSTVNFIAITHISASSTFCLLASVILVYYIRRRYCLHLEIKKISAENLWYANFQNHLKNLKIKATISNFVIIIVILEIVNNSSNAISLIGDLIGSNENLLIALVHISLVSKLCFFSLLSLSLQVVWLAYLHCAYTYTIKRWTAYILLRLFAFYFVYCWRYFEDIDTLEIPLYYSLFWGILSLYFILDLITYLMHSRKLYLHLKSRVLEAKLYEDRDKYLENKYVCIHFKVASIIVAVALTVCIIVTVTDYALDDIIFIYQPLDRPINERWNFYILVVLFPGSVGQVVYRIMMNLNYLYVAIVILFKYCRQKRNLNKVNDRIRPLVRDYQDDIFSRFSRQD